MDFVNGWSEKTGIGLGRFIGWLGIARSKFYNWHARYGKVNEHNGKMPRGFWLDDWEKQSIVHFHEKHPDCAGSPGIGQSPNFLSDYSQS
jgi:hypothetical protein